MSVDRGSIKKVVTIMGVALIVLWPQRFPEEVRPLSSRSYSLAMRADRGFFSSKPYKQAMVHFRKYGKRVKNRRYITVVDYTKPSFSKRMYVVDLRNYRVDRYLVSHGKNSGYIYAKEFSNEVGSFKSCGGCFLTGEHYKGSHGSALVLHGLEQGINDNALRRGVVLHGADYVSLRSVLLNRGRLGRSLGCPAVPAEEVNSIIDRIKDGSLLYIHTRG